MKTPDLARTFADVSARIADACAQSGRDPDAVTLVAVTKTVDASMVNEASRLDVGSGRTVFGENRVDELMRKIARCPDVTFHMIGTLQRNKASQVVGAVPLIHSVDSLRLLETIARLAQERSLVQDILIQVNVSGEPTKHGVEPEALGELVASARTLNSVRVRGLMTMAPLGDPEDARPYFRALKAHADELGLHELSMGMSNDYEVAIEEGATLVRIGSALFSGTAGVC